MTTSHSDAHFNECACDVLIKRMCIDCRQLFRLKSHCAPAYHLILIDLTIFDQKLYAKLEIIIIIISHRIPLKFHSRIFRCDLFILFSRSDVYIILMTIAPQLDRETFFVSTANGWLHNTESNATHGHGTPRIEKNLLYSEKLSFRGCTFFWLH